MEEEGGRVRLKGLAVWWTMRRLITWWVRNTECGNFYLMTEISVAIANDETGEASLELAHAKGPFSVPCAGSIGLQRKSLQIRPSLTVR